MPTSSMAMVNAAAHPAWTQAAASSQAAGALPGGSFSSQVAAIWNQSSSSPGAAGSASSANLKDCWVASSTPVSRTPEKTKSDSTPERKAAQVKPPASRSQTMQPASAPSSRHAVETQGRGTSATGTGAADTVDGVEDDASMTDAPQPDARTATGAAAKSLHKPLQATGARPDDGAAASALPPGLPAAAPVPPVHLPDVAKETPGDGSGGKIVTLSNHSGPNDDPTQQTDAAQPNKATFNHSPDNEAAGTGAGAAAQASEHHDDRSDHNLPDWMQAVDPAAANNTSAANLLSMMEPAALATDLVNPSVAASAGTSADAGPATASASATSMDETGAPAQVGTSLLTLASGTDGSSQMALSLHPKDLGDVHIQLARDADGTVRVVVAATEPTTLRSLITDQAHLHAALDAAAVPSGNRHVSFELTPASAVPDPGATSNHQPDDTGSSNGRTAMDMFGRDADRQSGDPQPRRSGGQDAAATPSDGPGRSSSSTRTLLLRQGSINITA